MAMKLPHTTSHCASSPALRLCARARFTWYSLMVMPTTRAPECAAMARMGPPTPQPTSSTRWPGLAPSRSATRSSWTRVASRWERPGSEGEKWKDWPQPHS
uniref:Uncharacterized protein n=1 Tax=Triticum urartu TaxID=4572 RepID=A0A8R7UP04_TRIUA